MVVSIRNHCLKEEEEKPCLACHTSGWQAAGKTLTAGTRTCPLATHGRRSGSALHDCWFCWSWIENSQQPLDWGDPISLLEQFHTAWSAVHGYRYRSQQPVAAGRHGWWWWTGKLQVQMITVPAPLQPLWPSSLSTQPSCFIPDWQRGVWKLGSGFIFLSNDILLEQDLPIISSQR